MESSAVTEVCSIEVVDVLGTVIYNTGSLKLENGVYRQSVDLKAGIQGLLFAKVEIGGELHQFKLVVQN